MKNTQQQSSIELIFTEIERLIPEYMKVPEDKAVSNGNVAICIIDESGRVHGRMYGTNKPRLRQSYRVAWTKASQVWLTGMKTGEYERKVFNKEIPENANGIDNPDLIGWEGGQPITLPGGEKVSVGFSGFRGATDLEIVVKALEAIGSPGR
jgi:glc operon protein GlcG